jgi:hypothetical protein
MVKRRLGIASISLRAGGVPHNVGKFLMKVIIFLETSSQLDVYTQSYGLPKV